MLVKNEDLSEFFEPREYQKYLFHAMDNGYKKALLVWPRRAGKDITVWHFILLKALERIGTYAYCLPTYSQCRSVIWTSIRTDEVRFLDMIPKSIISKINSSEMSITLTNGSIIRLVGSDAYDRSLVGSNVVGVVFSEFSRADSNAYKYTTPILQSNGGWCVILSTPYGKNAFYELYCIAKANPKSWFCQHLTIDDTRHISREAIQLEINSGEISYDLAQQEYFCSFDMGVEGSFYAKYVEKMRLDGRIGDVPVESHLPVHTAWDLGVTDECVIIYFQIVSTTIRIINVYSNAKQGLDHYIKEVMSHNYLLGHHIAPHDIRVREFGTGLTRVEMAQRLGLEFDICPNHLVMDGIECVRATMGKIYIDERSCKKLIASLENYRQEYDEKNHVYKLKPLHNFASHQADALRYLCVGLDLVTPTTSAVELNKRYEKVMTKDSWKPSPFSKPF